MNGLENLPAYLHGWALVGALAGFGVIIGVLTGLFGVGGGFMIVPMLNVAFGIPYNIAVGSSLSFTIGTGVAGTMRHMRLGNVEVKSALILAVGAMVGAVAGTQINAFLKHAVGDAGYKLAMEGMFIVILLVTAWVVYRRPADKPDARSLLQRLPLGPRVDLPGAGLMGVSLPALAVLGVSVGLLTGILGIGGGVLYVPVLIAVVGLRAHQAVGTSLGVVFLGSIAGTVSHGLKGNVNLAIAMSLLVGSVVGVQVGAFICDKLHARKLQRYFALLVLAVVAALVWQFVSGLIG